MGAAVAGLLAARGGRLLLADVDEAKLQAMAAGVAASAAGGGTDLRRERAAL